MEAVKHWVIQQKHDKAKRNSARKKLSQITVIDGALDCGLWLIDGLLP